VRVFSDFFFFRLHYSFLEKTEGQRFDLAGGFRKTSKRLGFSLFPLHIFVDVVAGFGWCGFFCYDFSR